MKKLFLLLAMVGMLATACESDSGVEDDNGNKTEQPGNGGGDDDAENPMNTLTSIAHFNPTGSATFNASAEGVFVTTKYEVLPKSCATLLAAEWKEYLKAQAIYPDSEDVNYIDMPITEVVADEENGVITVTASGENLSNDFYGKKQAASMRLVASDGNKEVRSEFKTLALGDKWFVTTLPTPAANEIYYIADALVNPKNTEVKSNIYNYAKGYYIITLTDEIHTIGEEAFSGRDNLTSIAIGNGVTSIGWSAFSGCRSLTNVTIGNSVTSIGGWAFSGCTNLTSVDIGNSVTSIGDRAFINCTSLTSITIPDSVTEIGEEAFYKCDNLTNVTIGNSVTSIGKYAFAYCSSLTSITIPDSVTEIGVQAFSYCSSWISFYGKYASSDNRCLIVDGVLNSFAPANLTSYTIPDSVTEIGESAFRDCSGLTSITIPDSVTEIGVMAFCDCTSLTSITIPDSVTTIGNSAFYGCGSLTSITIPDSVTEIGVQAFYNCTSITSVNIGNGVTSIGVSAFEGCTGELIINSNCLGLFGGLFTTLTIGDSVTKIGDRAFNCCRSLTSVTIPDSVISIGEMAFYTCSSLTNVTIGNGVTMIGDEAFNWCSSLISVTIPDSVTSIGESAFCSCSSLKEVYCKPTTPPTVSLRYGLAFYDNASGRKFYVPRNSVDAYKTAYYWRDYDYAIEGYDF